jgi:hypothetical protein
LKESGDKVLVLAWEHVAFMDSWKIKEKNEHALKINEAIVRLEYKKYSNISILCQNKILFQLENWMGGKETEK